jgi:uncharacterized SAM-binding protein YcdF (DUF218 family)
MTRVRGSADSSRRSAFLTGALLGALCGHLAWTVGVVVGDRISSPVSDVIGLFAGVVFVALGRMSALLAIDAALLVASLVIAFTPLAAALAHRWVRNSSQVGRVDAIVVLSSSMASDTALDAQGTERLLSGLELIRAGKAARLVTTRPTVRIRGQALTTDADQARLVSLVGVPRWDVVGIVHTTHDEAVKAAALLLPAGARRIALVTSPMHTRRACAAFEKVGFDVTCVAAREREYSTWHPAKASERLSSFRDYVYERLGMVKYRLEGWV